MPTKYTYVGDPKGKPHASGECRMVEQTTKEVFIFHVGEPVEVPPWVEKGVKNNSHFKKTESAERAEPRKEQANDTSIGVNAEHRQDDHHEGENVQNRKEDVRQQEKHDKTLGLKHK